MKTRHERLMEDPEYRRLFAIEALVTDAAELVARLMEEKRLSKADLARRLGKSRAWVTQLLSGKANKTIRTFAEVVHALGAEVRLSTHRPLSRPDQTSTGAHGIPGIHTITGEQTEAEMGPFLRSDNRREPGLQAGHPTRRRRGQLSSSSA